MRKKYSKLRSLLQNTNIIHVKDSVIIDTKFDREKAEELYLLLGEVSLEKEGLN